MCTAWKRSSYVSKPWLVPKRRSSTNVLTIAPVVKPRGLSISASVRLASGSRFSRLSRNPWVGGKVPVSMETWAGNVMGTGVWTFLNSTPSRATASMFGVVGRGKP